MEAVEMTENGIYKRGTNRATAVEEKNSFVRRTAKRTVTYSSSFL